MTKNTLKSGSSTKSNDLNLGLIHLQSFVQDEMLEHYSLSHHGVRFLRTQAQSFPDADLEDLSQVSQTAVEVISIDGEIVHEDLETVAKKVREDLRHASLECCGGIT